MDEGTGRDQWQSAGQSGLEQWETKGSDQDTSAGKGDEAGEGYLAEDDEAKQTRGGQKEGRVR